MRTVMNREGRPIREDSPDYDKTRIDNLERTVAELLQAVVDLQHRVSHLDGEPLQWPGDSYEPPHSRPF